MQCSRVFVFAAQILPLPTQDLLDNLASQLVFDLFFAAFLAMGFSAALAASPPRGGLDQSSGFFFLEGQGVFFGAVGERGSALR